MWLRKELHVEIIDSLLVCIDTQVLKRSSYMATKRWHSVTLLYLVDQSYVQQQYQWRPARQLLLVPDLTVRRRALCNLLCLKTEMSTTNGLVMCKQIKSSNSDYILYITQYYITWSSSRIVNSDTINALTFKRFEYQNYKRPCQCN